MLPIHREFVAQNICVYIGILFPLYHSIHSPSQNHLLPAFYFNCEKKFFYSEYFFRILKSYHTSSPASSPIVFYSIFILRKFNAKGKVLTVFWHLYFEHEFPITFEICITLHYKRDSHLQIVFTPATYTIQTRLLHEINGVAYLLYNIPCYNC